MAVREIIVTFAAIIMITKEDDYYDNTTKYCKQLLEHCEAFESRC